MSSSVPDEKLLLAVVAATCAACVTALLSGFAYAFQFGEGALSTISDPTFYQASFYVGLVAMVVTFPVCPLLFTIFGLPLYQLSLRLRRVSFWEYAVVGFAVSCAAAVGAFLAFGADRQLAVQLTIVGGTVATLVFWVVARPDIVLNSSQS